MKTCRIEDDLKLFSKRDMVMLIIPLIVEQTFTSLMGMADTLMVSGISESALSGISCVDTVNVLVLMLLESFGVGGNVLCSQYMGRRDESSVKSVVMQLVIFELIVSTGIALLFFCGAGTLLGCLFAAADGEVFRLSRLYFRITILSYPFLGLYCASAALYRSIGNSKLPVTVVTIGNLMNIGLNALLIYGFGMGVAGAGWATLVSRVFCAGAMLFMQSKKGSVISLESLRGFRFRRAVLGGIIGIGAPGAIENGMFQFGKIVVQGIVVTLGTTVIAAQAMITQIETLISRPALAIAAGMLTITGQYIGAGRPDIAEKYAADLSVLGGLCCLVTGAVTQVFVYPVCSLTALSAEATELVFRILLFIAVCKVFLWAGAFSLNYCLKAAGDVRYPMYATTISMWVFRVLLGFLLCRFANLSLWGVWIAWITDWCVRNIFFIRRFRRGDWKKLKLV